MHKQIEVFVFVLLAAACSNNETTKEAAEFSIAGDTIIVKEDSPVLKEIIVRETQLQDFSAEFRTVGTVRPVSGKLAEISPPFAGRIIKSFVGLGQRVSAGSPVFELGSADFYEATKAYFSARSASELARMNCNRQKDLEAHGVASRKELEQAENEAHVAAREFEQAEATLKLFNIDAASLQTGQALTVVSPIPGEVIKSSMTIGDYVKEDAGPLAVVADLSQVWVAALVKEKYFGSIRHGDRVEVYSNAYPDKVIWGTIHYAGEMLDEETRSLEVIVECNNTERWLKLGMFCEVHFLSSPAKAILLPSSAVMQKPDHDYVLVEVSKGAYIRRKVATESVTPDSVRIIGGLDRGERVVTKGGIFLNR
ncbi:MAG: efflux RND transporter periplasmic adaptor subunit [Tannerella sp.]|jgi:cobalt-zinc-cadmium efflux system membrane fusion protein|nr:efflux RND transporter periplasmic adaptor subunit [Tannerella sp.]